MLRMDRLATAERRESPFGHLVGRDLLDATDAAKLAEDFPDPGRPGFFPEESLACGPSVKAVCNELRTPEVSRIVGEKLQRDLVGRPQMIVLRRWSAARDGRPHTDGEDKVATALLYLNDDWAGDAGSLRYLEGPDLEGPGTDPLPARFGAFTAFARSDTSWHGHPPFTGERRVIQVFWLRDADAYARKTKRHARAGWLKGLWPSRRPA